MSKKKQPPRLLNESEKRLIAVVLNATTDDFYRYDASYADAYLAYFDEALRQNKTGELLTHQGEDWVNTLMNFRDGASTVIGTLCEYLAHLYFLRKGHTVLPLYEKEFQTTDRDFLVDERHYVSIKKYTGGDKMRLGDDYFVNNHPELKYITFVQLDGRNCFTFDIAELRQYFATVRRKGNPNSYTYESVSSMPTHRIL